MFNCASEDASTGVSRRRDRIYIICSADLSIYTDAIVNKTIVIMPLAVERNGT